MGVIIDLYEKMIAGTITIEEKNELHNLVISQHYKPDQPSGEYNPKKCPCEYGICDECNI